MEGRGLICNLRYAPVAANFREKFVHNNVLFSLVQEVTEKLGDETWQNLMRQYVLGPLGMKSAWFAGPSMVAMRQGKTIADGAVHHAGQNYFLDSKTYDGLEMIAPAASLCMSARDMYQWFLFLLKEGAVETSRGSRQLISRETLQMLFQGIQARGQDGDPVTEGYRQPHVQASYTRTMNSLGFITGSYRGYEFVSQDGSLPGYQSLATIIPNKNMAVFFTLLGDEKPKNFVSKVLMNIVGLDMMLQEDTWIKPQKVCSLMDNLEQLHTKQKTSPLWKTRGPINDRPAEDYAQTYKNWAFGDVVVRHNISGNSYLTLEYGKMSYRLQRTNLQNDTFLMQAIEGPLWYSTNADWYRNHNNLYAIFAAAPVHTDEEDDDDDDDSEEDKDDEKHHMERVMNVTIAGFDSHSDPVFAINARRPAYERERRPNMECSAPSSQLSSPTILCVWAITLILSVSPLFR
ncbi:penicillin-binding protein 4 [Plakobranchus ocellatus]|uniref:Penicillin-binding protein 4 n=1 Tax=Plakobranchus ocellatus TaxID=259542 RepID=A0AAV3XYX1_9GAST|nr:penicillin-binding protein 4 [Plakobranchus ocellatus]